MREGNVLRALFPYLVVILHPFQEHPDGWASLAQVHRDICRSHCAFVSKERQKFATLPVQKLGGVIAQHAPAEYLSLLETQSPCLLFHLASNDLKCCLAFGLPLEIPHGVDRRGDPASASDRLDRTV